MDLKSKLAKLTLECNWIEAFWPELEREMERLAVKGCCCLVVHTAHGFPEAWKVILLERARSHGLKANIYGASVEIVWC